MAMSSAALRRARSGRLRHALVHVAGSGLCVSSVAIVASGSSVPVLAGCGGCGGSAELAKGLKTVVHAQAVRVSDSKLLSKSCALESQTFGNGWFVDRADFVSFSAKLNDEVEVSLTEEEVGKSHCDPGGYSMPQDDAYWCSSEDDDGPRQPTTIGSAAQAPAFACLQATSGAVTVESSAPICGKCESCGCAPIGYKIVERILSAGVATYDFTCAGSNAPPWQPETIELAP